MNNSIYNIDLHHFPLGQPLLPERAKVVFQKTRFNLRQSQKARDRLSLAWNLLDMAAIQRIQNRLEGSIQALDEAKAIFELLDEKFGLAMVYQEYAVVYREMKRHSMFFDYANKAFSLLQTLKQPQELGWSHLHLAMALLDRNEYIDSLNHLKRAQAIFSEFQNRFGVAWSFFLMGKIFKTQRIIDQAEEHLNKALKCFSTSAPDSLGKAECLLASAEIEILQEKFESALSLLDQAKEGFQEQDVKDKLAWIDLRKAEILFHKNEKQALTSCNRTLISFRALRDSNGAAFAYYQRAGFFRKIGEPLKAWEDLRIAVRFHTDNSQLLDLMFDFREIAFVQFELNEIMYAHESLDKAIKIAHDLKLTYWITHLSTIKALMQMISNQWTGEVGSLNPNDPYQKKFQLRAALLSNNTSLVESMLAIEKSTHFQDELEPEYYLELGFSLWMTGQTDFALENWKLAFSKSEFPRYSTKKAEAALLLYLYSDEAEYRDLAKVEKTIKASNSRRLKEKIILFKNKKGFDKNNKMIINSIISPL
ncbi:MAG: hypothetical protein ACKVQC_04485 [Elusimicrobiota bacterium]